MRFYQAWQLYPQLPMKSKSILPDEGFDVLHLVVGTDDSGPVRMNVSCRPRSINAHIGPGIGGRDGMKHRVMVHCKCGREVPFGRMVQHWPKCPQESENTELPLTPVDL